jgi:chromosome segregation ATPase
VNNKEYLRRAREFNVQIENLCQFLPQDRVQDFTKMNPQELLKNTQISVCPQEIVDTFQKLIEKRGEQKDVSKVNADNLIKLKDAEERNKHLKPQIESFKARNKLPEKYDLCVKKKTWVEYDDLYKKLKDCEADRDKMADLVKRKTNDIKPLQIRVNKIDAMKDKLKENISEASRKIKSSSNKLNKLIEDTEKGENHVSRAKRDLQYIISEANDRENDINEMNHNIKMLQQDLEDAKKAEATDENEIKIQEIKLQIEKFQMEREKLLEKRTSISRVLEDKIIPAINRLEYKIKSISSNDKHRLDKLRVNFEDTYKANEWLKKHRHQLEGHVFAPILLEINVKDKNNAKYIENIIDVKDFISFCCTNKQDMAKLVKKWRNEMALSVNIAHVAPFDEITYHPRYPIENLAPLGFNSYLLDMIEGPAPILNYLCQLYRIHEIPVGNDRTYQNATKISEGLRKFFSTNHRFVENSLGSGTEKY